MKSSDIIRRAGRNLRQAKGRTFLTSLAIAVGACTITLAMAAGAGGRDYVQKEVDDRGLGGDGYIRIFGPIPQPEAGQQPDVAEYKESQQSESQGVLNRPTPVGGLIDQAMLDQIGAIEGVKDVNPNIYAEALYVSIEGQDKKLVAPTINIRTWPGNLVTTTGSLKQIADGNIIITQDYAKAFGFDQVDEAIGQMVSITLENDQQQRQSFSFTISGIINEPQATKTFYINHQEGLPLFKFQSSNLQGDTFDSAVAVVDSTYETEPIRRAIQQLGLRATSQEQLNASFLEAVNIAQWALVGFGALALLASIFGIINTQYISVLERTQQIGLMRAVGASRQDISRLFRYEAAWIGFLGGVIGVLVALVCKLAEPVVKNVLQMPDDFTILIYEPLTIAIILVVLILISMAAGFFPSLKAAKLDPIEALRTE